MHSGLKAAAAVLAFTTGLAAAQEYPTKVIRFMVPFPPGTATDALARAIGPKLNEMWGQPVVVENRPGAGSVVGTSVVANAPADGYTLLMVSASHAINATLYSKLPFDPVKDFVGVTPVALIPNVLIVHPSLPVKSVKDLIALAKAKPGVLNYTSAGIGSASHLNGELFRSTAGINVVHVPFKGFADAVTEIIAGRLEMTFAPAILATPHIGAGRVRPLAVSTTRRSAAFPNLPTMVEAGVKDCIFDPWFGVLVKAGTPKPIIDRLNAAALAALADPEIAAKLKDLSTTVVGSTPEQLATHVQAELAKWAPVVKASGAQLD